MKYPGSILRLSLAALLWLQVVAPFVHLASHAACHATCQTAAQDHVELIAQHAVPHPCAICQWLTGNPGVITGWQHMDGPAHVFTPKPFELATTTAHPAFDYNVAVARGPPARSLDFV